MKILVVEDQTRLGAFLRDCLVERSYTVVWVKSRAEAEDAVAECAYDMVILDLGLPDGDGLDVLRAWRQAGFNEPVLILSARDKMEDRISGLDLGADTYLPKPFGIEELLAHVRALLRRQSAVKAAILEHRGIKLDLVGHTVHLHGRPLDLTHREFALLEIFMQNVGRVLTRDLIAEKIWESNYDVDKNLLDVYMSRLRQKLGSSSDNLLLKTVRGVGYQMV